MPNISAQILYLNIAIFLFNFAFIQIIVRKLLENSKLKQQLNKNPEQEIIKANEKAQKIITKAVESANNIVSQTSEKVGQIDTKIDSKLVQLSQTQFSRLEKSTEKFQNESDKLLEDLSVKFEQKVEAIIKDLRERENSSVKLIADNIEKRIQETNEQMVRLVKEDFDKAKIGVQKYRESKEQQIDLIASELVKTIVKKVLPNVLSKEMHQELILEGIQKAKTDNVFL
ncbi:MAG: hypothetical protein O2871_01935 [bacterium]|nr:hypothetical protein [bacterium]